MESKKKLPESWEELRHIGGCYVGQVSDIAEVFSTVAMETNTNIYATRELARASIAVAMLSQLRKVYRDGWKPDWTSNKKKHCIYFHKDILAGTWFTGAEHFLSFQSAEIRDKFLENFKDLIKKAQPILGE